jgi:hypothetical protein
MEKTILPSFSVSCFSQGLSGDQSAFTARVGLYFFIRSPGGDSNKLPRGPTKPQGLTGTYEALLRRRPEQISEPKNLG